MSIPRIKGFGHKKRADRAEHLLDGQISPWARASHFALTAPRMSIERFLTRQALMQMVLDKPGSIVELGVHHGQGLMSFAHLSSILEPNHVQRRLYGFENFDGVGGKMEGSEAYLRRSIELFDQDRPLGQVQKVELIRGDACETIPQFIADNPHLLLSILYLDTTVAEPTRVALEMLYPRLVPGGLLVFDQLNFPNHPQESVAWLESPLSQQLELERFTWDSQVSFARKPGRPARQADDSESIVTN